MELGQTSSIHHAADSIVLCAVRAGVGTSRIPGDEQATLACSHNHLRPLCHPVRPWASGMPSGCLVVSHSTTTHGIVDNATSI